MWGNRNMNGINSKYVRMESKEKQTKNQQELVVDGSITIFMTFLFLMLFSLTGAVLDSTRFFSSGGYMTISAYGADMAVFGNYNRELFQEYQLFAYGGHDGIDQESWRTEFQQTLTKNLLERPTQKEKNWTGIFKKKYASVYQMGAIQVKLEETGFLGQEEIFMGQIDSWMKTTAIKDLSSKLLQQITGTDSKNQKELLKGLEEMEDIEVKQDESGNEIDERKSEAKETEKEIMKQKKSKEQITGQKMNPITFLKELMQDGVLHLVCEEEKLSENTVHKRETTEGEKESVEEEKWFQNKTGSGMLKSLLNQSDSLWNEELFDSQKKKTKLLLYASQVFDHFLSEGNKSAHYGLEYLISGKEREQDTIAYIVNRLLRIRTLINFIYVNSSISLREKSLVTATEIAAPLAAEAFVSVIQQSILLILALEEACIDITALLDGRLVPVMKNQSTFKMAYEQLCMASKTLFQKKAAAYPKGGNTIQLTKLSQGIGYIHYLWLMLLMTSWEKLYPRTLDLIQDDLRIRYNQSFRVEQCICQTTATVTYNLPMLSPVFLLNLPAERVKEKGEQYGRLKREITMTYGYQ